MRNLHPLHFKVRGGMRTVLSSALGFWAFALLSANAAQTRPVPPEWEAFRRLHPHHVQGIAVSEPLKDGARMLIVAEPPPEATLNGIRGASPLLNGEALYCNHKIGFDGWVRDVVFRVPKCPDAEMSGLCGKLHRYLFGSTYKAYVLPVPRAGASAKWKPATDLPLDFKVTAAELQHWLLGDAMKVERVEGGASPASLESVLRTGPDGVYHTTDPGLVVWVVDGKADIATGREHIRRFTLDSDLVLGAISGSSKTAIVGRERVVPVTLLPPLRVETIVQLAAVKKASLGQSYERTNAFAGRYDDKHDWAPIYLSTELIDTEYGSLLNITDQLLKSWSNSGQTKYSNFLYPDPSRWPFPAPIMRYLGVNQVVYNWNTKGVGYAIDGGPYALMALNRTGALPVSYVPGDGVGAEKVSQAEDRAYDYFASLNDPYLVRVVQYAALYQAFLNLDLHAQGRGATQADEAVPPLLLAEGKKACARLLEATSLEPLVNAAMAGMKKNGQSRASVEYAIKSYEKKNGVRLSAKERAQAEKQISESIAEQVRKDLGALRSVLRTKRQAGDEAGFQKFVEAFVGGRMDTKDERLEGALASLADMVQLRDSLVAAASGSAGGWIHTPAVVVSWNEGPLPAGTIVIGGHNLDGDVSVFHLDPAIKRGELRATRTAGGALRLSTHPDDVEKLGGIVREVGRRGDEVEAALPRIRRLLAEVPDAPRRAMAIALGGRPLSVKGERGLRAVDAPSVPGLDIGWSPRVTTPEQTDVMRDLAQAGSSEARVYFEKLDDGYSVTARIGDMPLVTRRLSTADSFTEVLQGFYADGRWQDAHMTVVAKGSFVPGELENMRRSINQELAVSGKRISFSGASKRSGLSRALEFARTKFHAKKVEFVRESTEVVSGGGELLNVDLRLTPVEAGRTPFLVRLRMMMAKATASVKTKVRQVIEKSLDRLAPESSIEQLREGLEKTWSEELRDLPLDLQIQMLDNTDAPPFQADASRAQILTVG